MQQEFGSPVEIVLLDWSKFRGALIFAHSFERIAALLRTFPQQLVHFARIVLREQGASFGSRNLEISGGAMSASQFVFAIVCARIYFGSTLQVWDGFARFAFFDQQFSQAIICVIAGAIFFNRRAQGFLGGSKRFA